jgi:enterochelin esterase family protein
VRINRIAATEADSPNLLSSRTEPWPFVYDESQRRQSKHHGSLAQGVRMRRATTSLALLCLLAIPLLATEAPGVLVSPTIASLHDALAQGSRDAEAQFWARIQKSGSPLIEQVPGSRDQILITFVWKGDADTRNVVLVNTAIASSDFAQSQLARIPNTDVWYRTYLGRSDARFAYELSVNDDMTPFDKVTDWQKRTTTFHSDPFNPRTFHSTIFGGRALSYLEGPAAPSEEWISVNPRVAKGTVEQTTFTSKRLANTRDLWIYTPPSLQKTKSAALPLLVVFDGGEYVSSVPTPTILDNLIAAKKIPPVVALFVGNPEGKRDEELNANATFAEFIATELIPWVRQRYPISRSPSDIIVAGSSSGGLAAAFLARKHPEIFGNVLSQSGAFWFASDDDAEAEMLARDFATATIAPLKFYMEVGTLEENNGNFKGVNIVVANRHLRDVLRAKRYAVTYHEYFGGHSDLNWRSGFGNGLLALLGETHQKR